MGRLALYAYGSQDAHTEDVDAELTQDVEEVGSFLKQHGIPSNLSENISGWSIVSLSPHYRTRARVLHDQAQLRVSLLDPTDFIIAKLCRWTNQDLGDADFVAHRHTVTTQAVQAAADAAIAASPKDTALFVFRKTALPESACDSVIVLPIRHSSKRSRAWMADRSLAGSSPA